MNSGTTESCIATGLGLGLAALNVEHRDFRFNEMELMESRSSDYCQRLLKKVFSFI
jgi:hypothetical protein